MTLLDSIRNMAPSEDPKFMSTREADDAAFGKLLSNGSTDAVQPRPLVPSVFQLDEDNVLTDQEKQYLAFTERHGFRGHEPSVLACLEQFRSTKDKAQLYRALSVIHHLLDIS